MSDDPSTIDPRPRSWIDKIAQVFSDEPTDTSSLLELLRDAEQNRVLGSDALAIIEGALQVSDMRVRDIMIPRAKAVTVPVTLEPRRIIERVAKAPHSRFPIVGESSDAGGDDGGGSGNGVDNVIGILLAKDLLPLMLDGTQDEFDVRRIMRPAAFVPESKRLNVMLREFREGRRHMAIVIDEYGGMSGIITIEDVLERIVGDIEDETDVKDKGYITPSGGDHIVEALTPIGDFNEHFGTRFSDEDCSTVGGLVLQRFGRIPGKGEAIDIGPLSITVLNADSRQVKQVRVTPAALPRGSAGGGGGGGGSGGSSAA